MNGLDQPRGRHVLPSFVERTSYGMKETNPYSKLFEERIVFLGAQIDDTSANDIMSQLLVLEAEDPEREITLYINSPGGSFTSLMAIYDTMRYVRPDILTYCLGQASSAAAVILAAGVRGGRFALPNARVIIHQPAIDVMRGQVSDLEIQAAELGRVRRQMDEALSRHTGRSVEEVRGDQERERIFTAEEAREYGFVDEVLPYRKRTLNGNLGKSRQPTA